MSRPPNRPLFACPCCGENTIGERHTFEICVVCMWEDDPVQSEDPDFEGGGNALSLKAARTLWQQGIRPGEA
jgi:hypothetical protein